jgi:hypothetical protein
MLQYDRGDDNDVTLAPYSKYYADPDGYHSFNAPVVALTVTMDITLNQITAWNGFTAAMVEVSDGTYNHRYDVSGGPTGPWTQTYNPLFYDYSPDGGNPYGSDYGQEQYAGPVVLNTGDVLSVRIVVDPVHGKVIARIMRNGSAVARLEYSQPTILPPSGGTGRVRAPP